ncbi:MAG: amidohydrolase family protein [Lachnospiraceae bacterium]|nr:amidohydrolase family protein [Lachnospiraceae bacterium]
MKERFSKVIGAVNIFDGHKFFPTRGYICIRNNEIVETGLGRIPVEIADLADEVISFNKELVMPGIVDTHTFFSGYAIFHVGADISNVKTYETCKKRLEEYEESKKVNNVLLGHGWNPKELKSTDVTDMLEQNYPEKPVILFAADQSTCIMNQKAQEIYQYTPDSCYPEKYYRVMREYLNDREFIEPEFEGYMKMMNSKGVTTVKEMGFDDFYGFTDFLREINNSDRLHLRTFFMSQPVGEKMNLNYAKKMRDLFTGNQIRFSGFNLMTDGTIAAYKGDLKKPYEGKEFTCTIEVPYDEIEKDVLVADAEGFRYSLHAQGDRAVAKVADIYEKCQMVDGKLKNRHALTDMEFSDLFDIERLGKIGVTAELYFQIMSLDPSEEIKNNIIRTIGNERGKNYWNRRKMKDSGMILSGATDLPLMITDIPEAIYHSCGGYLLDGNKFQEKNTIGISEILEAWTWGGQKNLGMENIVGTLEKGKLADIAVFDKNFENVEEAKNNKVVMTIMDGKVVYDGR